MNNSQNKWMTLPMSDWLTKQGNDSPNEWMTLPRSKWLSQWVARQVLIKPTGDKLKIEQTHFREFHNLKLGKLCVEHSIILIFDDPLIFSFLSKDEILKARATNKLIIKWWPFISNPAERKISSSHEWY